jgi:hypothetical protein
MKEETMQRKSMTMLGSWGMTALLSLAAVGICTQPASGQNNGNEIARSIEGGWLFTVVPPLGTPGPESFQALDTFSAAEAGQDMLRLTGQPIGLRYSAVGRGWAKRS